MYEDIAQMCMQTRLHTHTHKYIYLDTYTHINTCVYLDMHIMWAYIYVYIYTYMCIFIEGSLEVKLPTICRDGKAEVGRVRTEKSRSEKIRDGESQKKEDAGARKGREVAIRCVFPMISGSGGSKSNLAKAGGGGVSWPDGDEKLHAVVARSTFVSKKLKTPHVRTTFGS